MEKELNKSNGILQQLKKEKEDLDTDEEIVYFTKEINEKNKAWYKFLNKTHTQIANYSGIPFTKRVLSRPDGKKVDEEKEFYTKKIIKQDKNVKDKNIPLEQTKKLAGIWGLLTTLGGAISTAVAAAEAVAPGVVLAIEVAAGAALGIGGAVAAAPEILLGTVVAGLGGIGMIPYQIYKDQFEILYEEIQEKDEQYNYKADYYSAIGKPGRLKISFYIKKKDDPGNQARIKQIDSEIHQQESKIEECKEELK